MTAQVNWKKIRSEFQRLADVDKLKGEVQRIGAELRKFDFHKVLSPSAQIKVKKFEKRYSELMRTIHQAQRQMDREFNRILRQIKVHRTDVTKVVAEQKSKLEKTATVFQKRFAKKAVSKTAATRATSMRRNRTAARTPSKRRRG
jgi:hypothetical protein